MSDAMTIEEHAEMILQAAGTSLRHYTIPKTRDAILAAVRNAQAEAFEAGALAMREAAVGICQDYVAFCGDKPLWPDEPGTSIGMIKPADLRKAAA